MKILHIITGLGDGGAELTLYKICKYDKLTASTDWNSGSDYYMIKRPVRQKMRRICY